MEGRWVSFDSTGVDEPPIPYYDVTDLPTHLTKIAADMANQPGLPAAISPAVRRGGSIRLPNTLVPASLSRQRAALYSFHGHVARSTHLI